MLMVIGYFISLVGSLMMTGVIWIVQVVHYPAFDYVDHGKFATFADFHSRRITWVVAPVMCLEMAASVFLLWAIGCWISWSSFVLLAGIWAVTFFVSVPCHNKLIKGYDSKTLGRLILSNWLRTAGWTMRSLLLIFGLMSALLGSH